MDHLLKIQKLNRNDAEIATPVCLRIIRNEKGSAVYLNSTETVKTVALLEFPPGGAARGNHYHHHKHESIYILSGRLTLFYWLPEGTEIKQVTVEAGDLITIPPNWPMPIKRWNTASLLRSALASSI